MPSYKWSTVQKDGSSLDESRGSGLQDEERKNCKIFTWTDSETGHKVSVDLETGSFTVGDQVLHASVGDLAKLSGLAENYELIYAKRHFVSFGAGDKVNLDPSLYLIGWKTSKYKRILYIQTDGQIIFGGEEIKQI